jgi:hypothetical protein
MNANNKITPEQWLGLADGKKSQLPQEIQEQLRRSLDELRAGLTKQNLAGGRSFGAAVYESLEQCKSYILAKNQKNPAVEFLMTEHAGQKAKWSKEIMTSQFAERDLHDLEPEQVADIRGLGIRQTSNALGKLNEKIAEYDGLKAELGMKNEFRREVERPVAAQQSDMGAKPKAMRQGEETIARKENFVGARGNAPKAEMQSATRPPRPAEMQARQREFRDYEKQQPAQGQQLNLSEKQPEQKQQQLQFSKEQLMQWIMQNQNQNYRSAA